MQQPLLSIVTVTKNCGETIEHTLRSVQAIKSKEIEYLVVDGVSTDDTLNIIHRYAGDIDRLVSESDTGIYNAMNKGISLANGRYLLFINGDDELVPDDFPSILSFLRETESDVVSATTLVGSITDPSEQLVAKPWQLIFFNSIPHPSAFVKTELLKAYRFREDLRIVSDYDFFLKAYLAGKRFCRVPAVAALHQRGGASGNVQRSLEELNMVRRERLGWRYIYINGVIGIYRILKKIGRTLSHE